MVYNGGEATNRVAAMEGQDMATTDRYREADPGLVICRDCSTRTTAFLVAAEDVAEHDEAHARWAEEEERAGLLTQHEAREIAQGLTDSGTPAIATPVPPTAWGGTEAGWTVTYLVPGEDETK